MYKQIVWWCHQFNRANIFKIFRCNCFKTESGKYWRPLKTIYPILKHKYFNSHRDYKVGRIQYSSTFWVELFRIGQILLKKIVLQCMIVKVHWFVTDNKEIYTLFVCIKFGYYIINVYVYCSFIEVYQRETNKLILCTCFVFLVKWFNSFPYITHHFLFIYITIFTPLLRVLVYGDVKIKLTYYYQTRWQEISWTARCLWVEFFKFLYHI